MLAYLNAVVSARAVDQELAVDIDGNVVDLHPAFASAVAAAPMVGTVAHATACVLTGEEDNVACLKLRGVGEQNAHVLTLLCHRCGVKSVHRR